MSVWCASHRSLNTKLSLWTHDASESWEIVVQQQTPPSSNQV